MELAKANAYMTEVDSITGELDVSQLPEEMGVYACFDMDSRLQYIGLSRNIRKSIASHAEAIGIQEAGDMIASVRCADMPGGSKESLKATWESWIKEHVDSGGEIPPGNVPENMDGADSRWRARGAQARPPLNLGGAAGILSMAEATEAVKKAVTKHPVVIFMKGTPAMPQCGFSARSVGMLRETGVTFEAVNVLDSESNPGIREAVKEFSNWPTIPQLFVRGELVGGADIITEMHGTGQLKETLKSATGDGGPAADQKDEQPAAADVPRGDVLLIDDPSRPTATLISEVVKSSFDLWAFRLQDDSGAHEGDAGALEMGLTSESHFMLELVALEFEGLTPLQRQQKVFDVLNEKDVMKRVHAMSLVTRTPAEMAKLAA